MILAGTVFSPPFKKSLLFDQNLPRLSSRILLQFGRWTCIFSVFAGPCMIDEGCALDPINDETIASKKADVVL